MLGQIVTAGLLLFFGAAKCYESSSVLSPPVVVTAGVPAPVDFNFTASSCDAPFPSSEGCDWPYFRLWLMADPSYDSNFIVWRPYCMVSPCISTNLTKFDITIPPSAVPDGYPYALTYTLFRPRDNGSYEFSSPIWSAFESTNFNISGANTTWNSYDKQNGRFSTDNDFRAWWNNLTCDALECVRKCALDIEAPLVPWVGGPLPKLDECVEACPGMGWDPNNCITGNAVTVAPSLPSITASSTTSSSATGVFKTVSPTKASVAVPHAGGEVLWSMACVVLFAIAWVAV